MPILAENYQFFFFPGQSAIKTLLIIQTAPRFINMLSQTTIALGLLLAGASAQQAANCEYQSFKCGSVLLAAPFTYTTAQLTAAVNDTASIPALTTAQLSQSLFHCTDILGAITGNSYCFAGCDSKPGSRNDQCIL
ncbi:hypothetical protein N7522_007492 [Penicillium canescens]|nr:hypothetical protein N7522_007492 [Penicillium canescens]